MQDSLPAGWLAFAGRELNPLDRYERFPSCYISSPFPGFILTLDKQEHDLQSSYPPRLAQVDAASLSSGPGFGGAKGL
jgi:hypothetical protein